ncbi:MAG: metallophosphoesterase family protein [Clostridia bacterium]|nr:metallophosphoesterase family protein [Clostridia bacterium]
MKIVHLSDLHGKSFGRKNARLIAKIVKEKPDFIVITGDIIHNYKSKGKAVALELVSSLCGVAPVLYVSGNHEMRNKGYRFFRKDLKEAGAVVLDNSPHTICGLTVVGLNCTALKNDVIHKITPKGDGVKILLAHMPQFIDRYAAAGYDFVFCGHAHGGQWRIPFTRQGLYAPGQGKFPKLTEGVHERGKTKMIISRGLGNSECPLRLFNRPEIVVVEIK